MTEIDDVATVVRDRAVDVIAVAAETGARHSFWSPVALSRKMFVFAGSTDGARVLVTGRGVRTGQDLATGTGVDRASARIGAVVSATAADRASNAIRNRQTGSRATSTRCRMRLLRLAMRMPSRAPSKPCPRLKTSK